MPNRPNGLISRPSGGSWPAQTNRGVSGGSQREEIFDMRHPSVHMEPKLQKGENPEVARQWELLEFLNMGTAAKAIILTSETQNEGQSC